jgi:hypothetical protein
MIPSIMCDGSIEKPRGLPNSLHFEKLWVRAFSDSTSGSISLNELVRKCESKYSGEMLLQIDIEGSEWESLLSIDNENLKKIRIITGEFHNMDLIADKNVNRLLIKPVLERISNEFYLVHIHPNNIAKPQIFFGDIQIPPLVEMTFLRKDRCIHPPRNAKLPHPLDMPCVTHLPEVELSKNLWYKY